MINKKMENEKELMEKMNVVLDYMLKDIMKQDCEISIKNNKEKGVETRVKGDIRTVLITLVGVLKDVARRADVDFETIETIYQSLGQTVKDVD